MRVVLSTDNLLLRSIVSIVLTSLNQHARGNLYVASLKLINSVLDKCQLIAPDRLNDYI